MPEEDVMARVQYAADGMLPAQRFIDALTDFSDRRPAIWPGLSARLFRVHEVGDTSADVTEGSDVLGGIWAREHYEWSGGVVTIRCVESPFFRAGTVTTWRVSPTAAGCHVEVDLHRIARSPGGFLVGALVQLMGARRFSAELGTALARLAADSPTPPRAARSQRP
jgi:polyketide cyclase/dehydrase/lipid transport protein